MEKLPNGFVLQNLQLIIKKKKQTFKAFHLLIKCNFLCSVLGEHHTTEEQSEQMEEDCSIDMSYIDLNQAAVLRLISLTFCHC